MFAGLSLDFANVDAQLSEEPPVRKRISPGPYGIGASDVPKLMLALGWRELELAPRWMRREVAPMARMGGHSRFLLQKAGRVKRLKKSSTQLGGIRREAELFLAWLESLERGIDCPLDIDSSSVMWAGGLPNEFPPWPDKQCPRLCVRTDGWARTISGELVVLSLKCARYGYSRPAWWNGIVEPPWYYALQSQAEMAALNAEYALLIIGCGWLRDDDDPRGDGGIRVMRVDRDEEVISEIRQCVATGWTAIELLRAKTFN